MMMNTLFAANCWTWDVDPVLLDIYGPLQLRWYGLCFVLVFATGYAFYNWQFKRGGFDDEMASRFVNLGVFAVVAGSWFGHRLFYEFDRVLENPFYLIDVSNGLSGLASHGATIGLLVALFWFAKREKIPVWQATDRFAWSATMGIILVRFGNLMNSEIIGRKTDVAWAICMTRVDARLSGGVPTPRHPSQLYEVAMGILILLLLFALDKAFGKEKRPPWLMTSAFLMSFGVLRFTVEFFKAHQTLDPNSLLTMGQVLSIPVFLLGLGVGIYALKNAKKNEVVA